MSAHPSPTRGHLSVDVLVLSSHTLPSSTTARRFTSSSSTPNLQPMTHTATTSTAPTTTSSSPPDQHPALGPSSAPAGQAAASVYVSSSLLHSSRLTRTYVKKSKLVKDDPFHAARNQYHQARGALYELPDTRPTQLASRLEQAEALLFQHRPVALSVNSYPFHHAVQVLLSNTTVISYVFDPVHGDLSRVYIDSSPQLLSSSSHGGGGAAATACSTGLLLADKLVAGLSQARLMAVFNGARDKAKRPYLTMQQGVSNLTDLPADNPHQLSINATSSLLSVRFSHKIALYQFAHPNLHAQGPGATPAGMTSFDLADTTEHLSLFLCAQLAPDEGERVFFCFAEFEPAHPHMLFVCYLQDDSVHMTKSQRRRMHQKYQGRPPPRHQSLYVGLAVYDAHTSRISLPDRPLRVPLVRDGDREAPSLRITALCRDPHFPRMVVGCDDGTLILLYTAINEPSTSAHLHAHFHEAKRIRVQRKHEPSVIRFHPSSSFFIVAFANGEVCAYSSSMTRLRIFTERGEPRSSLQVTEFLPFRAHVTHAEFGPSSLLPPMAEPAEPANSEDATGEAKPKKPKAKAKKTKAKTALRPMQYSSAQIGTSKKKSARNVDRIDDMFCRHRHFDADTLVLLFDRGPLVLVQFHVGARMRSAGSALTASQFSERAMCAQYACNLEFERAIEAVRFVPDDRSRFECFVLLMHILFRQETPRLDLIAQLLRVAWPFFRSRDSPHHEHARRLYYKHFSQLVHYRRYEDAVIAAKELGEARCFVQLRNLAAKTRDPQLRAMLASLRQQPSPLAGLLGDRASGAELPVEASVFPHLARALQEHVARNGQDSGAHTTQDEVIRRGLQLEAEGRLQEALQLYRDHRLASECIRVKALLAINTV